MFAGEFHSLLTALSERSFLLIWTYRFFTVVDKLTKVKEDSKKAGLTRLKHYLMCCQEMGFSGEKSFAWSHVVQE